MRTNIVFVQDGDRGSIRCEICAAWVAGLGEQDIVSGLGKDPVYIQEEINFLKLVKVLLPDNKLDEDVRLYVESGTYGPDDGDK